MNLDTTIYAIGTKGHSGCNPDVAKCGRPRSAVTDLGLKFWQNAWESSAVPDRVKEGIHIGPMDPRVVFMMSRPIGKDVKLAETPNGVRKAMQMLMGDDKALHCLENALRAIEIVPAAKLKAQFGAKGMYINTEKVLQVSPDVEPEIALHELGHAMDYGSKKQLTTEGQWLTKAVYTEYKRNQRILSPIMDKWLKKLGGHVKVDQPEPMAEFIAAGGKAVSMYSMMNHHEWFAESFKTFHKDPQQLKNTCPATYKLIQGITTGRLLK